MFQRGGRDVGIRRAFLCVVACGLGTQLFACSPRTLNKHPSASGGGVADDASQVQRAVPRVDPRYGKLQMSFEPNRGQASAGVNFLARGGGYSLYLEPTQAVFALSKPSSARARAEGTAKPAAWSRDLARTSKPHTNSETSILAMRLVGASTAAPAVGESPLAGRVNYYIGNDPKHWHENVPTFGRVRYSGVYPGVDLVYYGTEGQLEYDFIVAPGADPGQIRVAFDGAQPKLDANGDIVLARGNAEIHLRNLIVYQQKAGGRQSVTGHFVLSSDHQVRLAVADYDRSRALVIDPTVVYATYLGGPDNDTLWGLAVDSKGSAVVVGDTQAGGGPGGFPVTKGAFQATDPNPSYDAAFVSKLSPDGSSLVFSTYLGGVNLVAGHGGEETVALAAAVDPHDGIYVGGWTAAINFPTTAGAAQPVIGGGIMTSQRDGFVTKLSPTGTMSYSTYIGGYWADYVIAIAVDAAGDAHVTGRTQSYYSEDAMGNPQQPPYFPTTPNAYQAPFRVPTVGIDANYEPFLTEFDPTGSKLLYSTLLAPETCVFQCTDGSTCTNDPNSCAAGNCNTYCGGTDYSVSIAIGNAGIAYIGGWTYSPHFPTTAGALQTVSRGGGQAVGFVAAFDPTKSGAASLVYSTFLGGTKTSKTYDGEAVAAIAADAAGNVYATGHTSSVDFPTTPGAYATTCTTDPTAPHCGAFPFVSKLDPTGSKLVYSTFILDGADDSYQIAIDAERNAYVLSRGHSPNFRFIDPVSQTGGVSIQTLSADGSKLLFSTLFSSEVHGGDPPNNGFVVDRAGNIYVASTNGNHDLPATPGAFQTTPGLDSSDRPTSDGYVVKISPIAASVPTPDGGVDGTSGSGGTAGGASGLGDAGASVGGTNGVGGPEAGSSGLTGTAANDAGDASAEAGAAGDSPAGGVRVVHRSGGDCSCGVATNDARGPGLVVVGLLVVLSRRRRRPAPQPNGAGR